LFARRSQTSEIRRALSGSSRVLEAQIASVTQLADEQRRLQAKVLVHEMLLLQTFLRFADATGRRKEFST